MVYAYAHGGVMLFADAQERNQAILNLLQFGGIFLVRVVNLDKLAGGVGIVAGIYSYFLGIESGHVCHVGIEVHVRHQWCVIAVCPDSGIDIPQVFRLSAALRGESYQLTACLDDFFRLFDTCLGVIGVGSGH